LKKLLEEEKTNYEKREANLMLQKREMQMEIQRLNERESKRRKLAAVNSNGLNIQHNNQHSNTDNLLLGLKAKLPNCIIY
jgi:hypothetical protein